MIYEKQPLPEICQKCEEQGGSTDCCECEKMGERWIRSREDQLYAQRTLKIKAIQRLTRELEMIDSELADLLEKKRGGA